MLIPLVATCCASCGKRRTSSSSSSSRVRTILIVVVSSLAACGVALASLALAANQRMNGGVRTTVDGVSEALPQVARSPKSRRSFIFRSPDARFGEHDFGRISRRHRERSRTSIEPYPRRNSRVDSISNPESRFSHSLFPSDRCRRSSRRQCYNRTATTRSSLRRTSNEPVSKRTNWTTFFDASTKLVSNYEIVSAIASPRRCATWQLRFN